MGLSWIQRRPHNVSAHSHAKFGSGNYPRRSHRSYLITVGNKRVIAFFEPDSGNCALHAVIWNTADVNADTTSRFRTNLNPRQMVTIDTPDNQSLKLQCGDNADRLAIVENKDFIAAGAGN
jgi:hypothetical protein